MTTKEQNSTLDDAPEHVKLAVDLIYLLESNEIPAQTAIKALELVKTDLVEKLNSDN